LVVEHGEPLAGSQHRDGVTPDKFAQVAHRQKSVFLGNLLNRLARHRGRASGGVMAKTAYRDNFPAGKPSAMIFLPIGKPRRLRKFFPAS